MTEFKKGDRVKVTVEGGCRPSEVSDALGVEIAKGDETYTYWFDSKDVTIEKLPDPLPTTPGSVIRRQILSAAATIRFLARDGKWYTPLGACTDRGYGALPESLYDGYEVVYDAGAEK